MKWTNKAKAWTALCGAVIATGAAWAVIREPLDTKARALIAQEAAKVVDEKVSPLADYVKQDIEHTRDQILIASWDSCMQYATGYSEGRERQRRCNRERQYLRDRWQWEDCKREKGEGHEDCEALKPEPEISPDTRREP